MSCKYICLGSCLNVIFLFHVLTLKKNLFTKSWFVVLLIGIEAFIIIIYSLRVFHWSLSDIKSPQVSRALLSILAVLNKAVVSIVSTRPPTSKSSNLFNNPLVTVPKALFAICIIVTFMLHSFFNSLTRSRYLSFFSLSFSFILWSVGTAKSTIMQILFYYYYYYYLLIRVFHISIS